MIPPHRLVEVEAEQFRRLGQDQIALFRYFTNERLMRRFVDFDAPARQMPARDIGMPDEENPPFAVKGHPPHAQRHGPLQTKIDVEQTGQQAPAPCLVHRLLRSRVLKRFTHQFRIIQI